MISSETLTGEVLRENGIRTRIRHKPSEGSEEVLDSIRAGYVSYVINTRAIKSGIHYGDGVAIRRCAAQNNITMDACLGLYDDYYGLYVAVGQIPAP